MTGPDAATGEGAIRRSLLDTFGRRVRGRRLQAGLTQADVAQRSGLQRAYIGHIEQGTRNITLHNLLRVAAAVDTDAAELVTGLPDTG